MIAEVIKNITSELPASVKLIAVSKFHPVEAVMEAYNIGQRLFGENKVQEIVAKYDDVKPVRWHLIGHLQTNKVKYIIDKVSMIHSVDSLHLAKEINKRAAQHDVTGNMETTDPCAHLWTNGYGHQY